ncbi:hypothetical protein CJ030_MR1G008551 [Morella rubra]|uniref:Uncharacterized protein n=1 Tax=Morella rubra TaxID=262757 RepID=A0A6A1WKS2_9ROSI|nr:hypothetical protein CJ030_MR1G008551 [Morella rubra]
MAAKRCRKGGCSSQRSSEQIRGAKALQPRSSQHSLQDRPLGSSDDSTQPPDGWLEQGDNPNNERCEAMSRATMQRWGKAKGTEFAKLRKLGRVPVNVPSGARGPSSTNALVFAARVTYIVRTFADMKHKWWTLVPKEDKEELYTRVLNICQQNAINRRKLKVPHTSGSKSLQNLRAEQSDKDENLIAFYKRSHLRKSDGKFINEVAEQT